MNYSLPKMPTGYFLMQNTVNGNGWHILRDEGGPLMRKLVDKYSEEVCFALPEQAATYAHKHSKLKLKYNQEVPETKQ